MNGFATGCVTEAFGMKVIEVSEPLMAAILKLARGRPGDTCVIDASGCVIYVTEPLLEGILAAIEEV